MTEEELVSNFNQYTEREIAYYNYYHRNSAIAALINLLPVQDNNGMKRLHCTLNPERPGQVISEEDYFSLFPEYDILVTQHDRYSPAIPHSHDFYELIYVYEGEFVQLIHDQKMLMQTGNICMIPPGVTHALDVHNYSVVLTILIKRKTFQDIILNSLRGDNIFSDFLLNNTYTPNLNDFILFLTNGNRNIQQVILTICLEHINQQELGNQLVQIYLTLLFGYLHRDFGDKCVLPDTKQKKDSQGYEILRYINKHLQSISLLKLADSFHYSEQYISRRIKQITGMAYSEYLTHCRMQEAGRLLTETTLKINVVGECVGYNSPENFNRMFQKYYHMSPGQYRSDKFINYSTLSKSEKDETAGSKNGNVWKGEAWYNEAGNKAPNGDRRVEKWKNQKEENSPH